MIRLNMLTDGRVFYLEFILKFLRVLIADWLAAICFLIVDPVNDREPAPIFCQSGRWGEKTLPCNLSRAVLDPVRRIWRCYEDPSGSITVPHHTALDAHITIIRHEHCPVDIFLVELVKA
jgi:hypothetical protein